MDEIAFLFESILHTILPSIKHFSSGSLGENDESERETLYVFIVLKIIIGVPKYV